MSTTRAEPGRGHCGRGFGKMGKHSSGKNGFEQDKPSVLAITDAARNRLTAGITLSIRNKYFPTDLRIN